MRVCQSCGNAAERSFTITLSNDESFTFDCLECAIRAVAPRCRSCGTAITGRALEVDGVSYCSEACRPTPLPRRQASPSGRDGFERVGATSGAPRSR